MANKWIKHLNQFRKKHPKLTLKEAMQEAGKTYKSAKKEVSGIWS